MNTTKAEKIATLKSLTGIYLLKNFHKLSENNKIKVALCLLTTGKKPSRLIIEFRDRNKLEYSKWRKEVFKRDNFTCSKCGEYGGTLNAHHIEHWVDNKAKRFDVTNGQTLCVKCHKDIHRKSLVF